jgi:hypothetical protein
MFRHLFNRAIFVGATFGNARWELYRKFASADLACCSKMRRALLDGGCKNFSYEGTKLKGDLN